MMDRQHINAYIDLLEGLTASNVDTLRSRCRPDIHFRDPFNEVHGIEAFVDILAKMFAELRSIEFRVTERAFSSDGVFLRWVFAYKSGGGSTGHNIEGVSVIKFDDQGLVIEHVDYWDAASQIYERIPVLGQVFRVIRRRLGRTEP